MKLQLTVLYLLAVALAAAWEIPQWLSPDDRAQRLTQWLSGVEADVLPFVPWLLVLPILWLAFPTRRRRDMGLSQFGRWLTAGPPTSAVAHDVALDPDAGSVRRSGPRFDFGALIASMLLGCLAFGASWQASGSMRGLPPAYHDEYSYLFQAKTFLAGRVSYPSFEPRPELFNQMHVLNEGRFAGRYFPGVAAWMTPFLALGDPWLGHQVAFACVTFLTFLIGRELSGNGVGLLAGFLTAISPGIILFSTVLLSHLPTLAGLMLFLWAYLRGLRTGSLLLMVISGTALTFAMLCRPMTAAGFAAPLGLYFACWWIIGDSRPSILNSGFWKRVGRAPVSDSKHAEAWEPRSSLDSETQKQKSRIQARTLRAFCLGGPLIAGFIGLAVYDQAITGNPFKTPYQLYTDVYTPRHVYGFNNVVRGEKNLGPKVVENYDRWAENLTPRLAVRNAERRILSSMRYTLGLLPMAASLLVLVVFPRRGSARWWLLVSAIFGLHAAHIPYWYEGIMGWHYVFEAAPLWLLLAAEATRRLTGTVTQIQHGAVKWGWFGMLATALAVNLTTIVPLWPGRLQRGIAEIRYPREKYAVFEAMLADATQNRPSIVLIIPDPADRHMDYVTNDPSLSGPILRGRLKSTESADEVAKLFPKRDAWLYDARSNSLSLIRRASFLPVQ